MTKTNYGHGIDAELRQQLESLEPALEYTLSRSYPRTHRMWERRSENHLSLTLSNGDFSVSEDYEEGDLEDTPRLRRRLLRHWGRVTEHELSQQRQRVEQSMREEYPELFAGV